MEVYFQAEWGDALAPAFVARQRKKNSPADLKKALPLAYAYAYPYAYAFS